MKKQTRITTTDYARSVAGLTRVNPAKLRGRVKQQEDEYVDRSFRDNYGRAVYAGDLVLYVRNNPDKRSDEDHNRLAFVNRIEMDEIRGLILRLTLFVNAQADEPELLTLRNTTIGSTNRIIWQDLEDYKFHSVYMVVQVMRQRLSLKLGIPRIRNRQWRQVPDLVEAIVKEGE